jgi:tellurite resistance protein TerC
LPLADVAVPTATAVAGVAESASIGSPALWVGFLSFVAVMLALDLGVFHRSAHQVRMREAAMWSAVWVTMACIFAAGTAWQFGSEKALEFVAGWVVEKALSVDNLFVFVVIFAAFRIPAQLQHRVLFWGILGALVLRALFVWLGGAFLARFHWAMYVFGGILIVTGIRLLFERGGHGVEESGLVRLVRRFIPVTDGLRGQAFFVHEHGKKLATPLFLALVAVELTDVVFAVDSIPAVFAVSRDPFIVFTSNIFAILGLRSLYFLLAGVLDKFHRLKIGLALVLLFVGSKMLIADHFKVPIGWSLGVIVTILATSIVASLVWPARPALDRVPRKEA